MYIYDTRSKNDKSLPLNGWLFPCIFCFTITGQTKKKIFFKNKLNCIKYSIPCCNKCKKGNKIIDNIDMLKIKYQN